MVIKVMDGDQDQAGETGIIPEWVPDVENKLRICTPARQKCISTFALNCPNTVNSE